MTTLLPTSQSTGVEAYEDMFKEITRKLYGDEATAHGLYPHNTQVAQLAPGAPSAPPDGGERSFTTLTQIGYDAATGTGQQQQQQQQPQQQQQQHPQQQSSQVASGDAFKAGEHISTAFGLAALMQGGFPPPGTILNPVNFPPGTSKTPTNISGPSGEDRWAGHHQQQASADEQGSWHAGKHSASPATSSYRGKSYKKPKTERHDGGSPVTAGGLNIPSTADRSKGNNGGGASGGYSATGASTSTVAAAATGSTGGGVTPIKRYTCSSCPYTTDRRDLFTRHENIHKEEKPFQCYACLKPFNRADHVKKHFLRMHRELEYDIAKTRRYPPGTSSSSTSSSSSSASASAGSSGTKSGAYYSSAANGSGAGGGGTHASTVTSTSSAAASSSLTAMPLNIPSTGSYTSGGGGGGLSSHVLDHHAMLNSGHSSHLLQLQQAHHQHQQQQQQQQQQHHSVQTSPHALQSISVKQEKTTTLLNTSGSSVGSLGEDKSFPKKVKGEKKFSCAFCPWAGTDNWGLKRHLNTHTKPYVCLLCDYKAARSERLATHVFKVHNRKACGKCNFIADDQSQLDAHLHEAHPHEATKASNISSNNNNNNSSSNSNGGKGGAAALTQHQHPLHHHHLHHHHHSQHLPPPALPPPSVSAGGVVVPSGSSSASSSSSSSSSSSNSNAAVLRNLGNAFPSNNLPTNIPTTGNGFGNGPSNGHYHATNLHHAATGNVLTNSNAANLIDTINQHLAATTAAGTHQHQQQQQHHHNHHNRIAWRRRRGAELLYSYLEADGSDSGDYARLLHMQAVGRNKASVTQDFHNAGGGDYNGINGHASPPSSSPSAKAATMDRKNGANTEGSDGGSVKIPATSSLASLLGGDQLSFLQLLATAAVAQQHLQLQSGQHNKKQHQQHQQPHLIQPKQPSMTNGSYSSPMASSPPATSTPHQHQHNSSSSSSISNNAHSTNGGTLVAAQPLPLVKRRRTTNNELSNDKENLLYRKTTMASGVIVNNSSLIANGVTIAATASLPTITNGRNGVKNGHHHHHHHHNNNNNNNSSTNNKNINDIFDKVYKKPQSTFAKQQPILRTAPPSAIEEDGTGPPPPPVATDYTDPANQYGTEKFSLAEFLKNHTEVSISTVGGAAVTNTGKEDGKANRTAPPLSSPSIDDVEEEGHDSSCSGSSSSSSSFTSSSRKRKADNGERNPRKQQQPRRIDGFEVRVEPVAVKTEPSPSITPPPAPEPQVAPRAMLKVLSPAEVVSKLEERKERDHAVQRLSESEEEQKKKVEAEKSSTKVEKAKNHDSKPADEANTQESPSKLADIRDKHMIQLVTRRLCCRICQHKGALEHLDNCHYHSKISLLLHTRWRHQQQRGSPIRCRQCDNQFPRLYKLILHQKLTGHKGTIDKSVNDGGTEPDAINSEDQGHGVLPKKQRKRKPRSQCFTRRRK